MRSWIAQPIKREHLNTVIPAQADPTGRAEGVEIHNL